MPTPVPKTAEAIQAEIDALTHTKTRVKRHSFFNDDNHAAIDAQIHVLTERLALSAVHDHYEAGPTYILDCAVDAHDWMNDLQDADQPSPSQDWSDLVR